jgi:hypothetical protein
LNSHIPSSADTDVFNATAKTKSEPQKDVRNALNMGAP